MTPPWKDKGYSLPFDITPKLQLTRVEILTWGVRNLKDYKMIPVDSPHLEIEVCYILRICPLPVIEFFITGVFKTMSSSAFY